MSTSSVTREFNVVRNGLFKLHTSTSVQNFPKQNGILPESVVCRDPLLKTKSDSTDNIVEVQSHRVTFLRTYRVVYLGYAVLDRRYTLPMLPWVIAEIKHYGAQNAEEIYLEVTESCLKAVNTVTNKLVFEHKLQTISKFGQTTQDPTYFTYMTREVLNGPCAYHVFQAIDECTVLELFTTLREMTKEMVNQQSVLSPLVNKSITGISLEAIMTSGQHYEVLYLGRIKVCSKRAPPTFIDDAVEKFHAFEIEKLRNQQNCRQRHGSGASVSSLPHNLDLIEKPRENELGFQAQAPGNGSKERICNTSRENSLENLSRNSMEFIHRIMHKSSSDSFRFSPQKTADSTENIHSIISPSLSINSFSQSEETCSPQPSPSKQVLMPPTSLITHTQSLDSTTSSSLAQELQELEFGVCPLKQTSLPVYRTRVGSGDSFDMHRPRAFTTPASVYPSTHQRNRTMLFLIGQNEVCLIGMDKKQVLLNKTFNDIAHCSQGQKYLDYFGFICRETATAGADFYAGYIFRCQTEKVVDEIMQSLKKAFQKAHQDYQQHPQPKNPNVPRVIICEACPMQWFHQLCSDLEGLPPEKTHCNILSKLRTLPECDHDDIMQKCSKEDVNCLQEQNEVLMMLLRELCEQKQIRHTHLNGTNHHSKNDMVFTKEKSSSKLDMFRMKAKRSLSSSFETILKLKHKDESKIRSLSSISDNSIVGHTLSVLKDEDGENVPHREGSYDERETPAGRRSPLRPRSSTISTTQEARKPNKKKKPSISTSTLSPQSKSPIMNIFMKVGNQTQTPPGSGDESDSPIKKGSWRQAIFQRVHTPVAASKSGGEQEKNLLIDISSNSGDSSPTVKRSKEELRALWKKAIQQQVILIRMEKENKKLQVNQDAATNKRMKLDYEDVTPCLKDSAIKWEELLNAPDRLNKNMEKEKLLELIKSGIPRNKRGEIWQFLAEQHNMRNVSPSFNQDMEFFMPYEELLRQLTSHQHSILIDLGRTFPNHPFYSQSLGPGQLSLFNLLKAYSLLDKEVGYCQGLSFVAGVLLLHMPEEKAFLMMKHVLFRLGLRRQYKPDMVAFQIQMYQLSRLMHDNYRELYDHLERNDIAPTLYAAPWFLTLFASQFPLGFVGRLFDMLFMQGQEVIFKAALVLMGNHKDMILQCHGFESIMEFLKTTLPSLNVIEMQRVFNQMFSLDISKQLHAYEVEFHVIKEEMLCTPSSGDSELETANRKLNMHNVELMEQLQVAYSTIHNLEATEARYKNTVHRLNNRIEALEEEKEALNLSITFMEKRLQNWERSQLLNSELMSEGDCLMDKHPPSFKTVYALAGSEKEEDIEFKKLIRDICEDRDKMKNDHEENDWVMIKEEESSTCLSEEEHLQKVPLNQAIFLNCDKSDLPR